MKPLSFSLLVPQTVAMEPEKFLCVIFWLSIYLALNMTTTTD